MKKQQISRVVAGVALPLGTRVFDIVNGFFKSMPRRRRFERGFGFVRAALVVITRLRFQPAFTAQRFAEWRLPLGSCPALMLVVWALKREVRAIRGCLGMYRRRRTWHAAISVGEV